MGIFDRNRKMSESNPGGSLQGNQSPKPSSHAGQRPIPGPGLAEKETYIGKKIRLKGDLHADESVHIDGTVEGAIHCGAVVTVGTHGQVQGDINAKEIHVYGMVKGNLNASGRVRLYGNARVRGDVTTPLLAVAETAFIKGRVTMKEEASHGRESTERPGNQKERGKKVKEAAR